MQGEEKNKKSLWEKYTKNAALKKYQQKNSNLNLPQKYFEIVKIQY